MGHSGSNTLKVYCSMYVCILYLIKVSNKYKTIYKSQGKDLAVYTD